MMLDQKLIIWCNLDFIVFYKDATRIWWYHVF